MEEYKSNSHKSKEKTVPSKKIEKVIEGTAKFKKKNEIRKIADIFISEDAGNVKSYIFTEVLIPAVKKTIDDIFTRGLRMLLWGDKGTSTSNSPASKLSYREYYDKNNDRREYTGSSALNSYDYRDILFDNRGDAEEVLSRLEELISVYRIASVADFYDLCGKSSQYTDNKYGWQDIRNASIVRVRDGYVIKLPKVMPLD